MNITFCDQCQQQMSICIQAEWERFEPEGRDRESGTLLLLGKGEYCSAACFARAVNLWAEIEAVK